MRFRLASLGSRLAILTLGAIVAGPIAAHAADAPEAYSSYEDEEAYVATRERGTYFYEEEPIEEQVVVRRRYVEVVAPRFEERRVYVRHARRSYASPYHQPRRDHDWRRRRGYMAQEVVGGW